MKRILVTGVGGFIGSKVADRLDLEGFRVIGVDDFSNGFEENVPKKIDFIEGDLSKKNVIDKLPNDVEAILHLAGQSSGEISFDNPVADLNKNTISTLNLIDYGIKVSSKRFVYASSMAVYGQVDDYPVSEGNILLPLSCYGNSKLSSEKYLEIYKNQMPYISLRMFNVYGPGQDLMNLRQGMVSIFVAQALKNQNIIIKGSLDRYRDFIYIDDVVEAWFKSLISKKALNRNINLGTQVRTSVRDLIEKIIENIPGVTYEVTNPTLGDQFGIYSDNTALKKYLDMVILTDLNTGLKSLIDWSSSRI